MLFGTSLLFRFFYFFTSFTPTLFLLSLNFGIANNIYTITALQVDKNLNE